jgi:hypothetical protein
MIERKPPLIGIPHIEGSEAYYQVTERTMNTFSAAYPAYRFVIEKFVLYANPEFNQAKPEEVCILGGFYPSHANIEKTHELAATVGINSEHCHYVDLNPEPARILSATELTRFHQVDLSKLADAKTPEGQPLIAEGSVKLIILDHVTEFMDDETLLRFFETLSRLLAPDGVALMSTVEVINPFEQLWQRVKGIMVMKTQAYVRREKQWRKAFQQHLANPAVLNFPLDKEDRRMYVLTKQDSIYGAETGRKSLLEDEYDAYVFSLSVAANRNGLED